MTEDTIYIPPNLLYAASLRFYRKAIEFSVEDASYRSGISVEQINEWEDMKIENPENNAAFIYYRSFLFYHDLRLTNEEKEKMEED